MKILFLVFFLSFIAINNTYAIEAHDVEDLKNITTQGDIKAMHLLGLRYYHGDGLDKNHNKAMGLLRKAAAQGSSQSQVFLGEVLFKGQEVKKDYIEAKWWLEKASMQGNVEAQFNLGNMYLKGQGGEEDVNKAKLWFERVADQDINNTLKENAKITLGIIYLEKLGDKNDYKKARSLFYAAPENSIANYYLGVMSYKGKGTKTNYIEANSFFEKAAKENNIKILKSIAYTYEAGNSFEQDFFSARKWYAKAAELGDTFSQEKLIQLPKYRRFMPEKCSVLSNEKLPDIADKKILEGIIKTLNQGSIYRFLIGRDSAVGEQIQEEGVNPSYYKILSEKKEGLSENQISYMSNYIDHYSKIYNIYEGKIKENNIVDFFWDKVLCNTYLKVDKGDFFDPEFKFSKKNDRFGDFEITINSCNITNNISGGRNVTPDKIDGTRFLVVNSSFKNMSHSPQRIRNGYITIRTIENKLYKFENEDLFMSEYSVSSRKINPLISRSEKILFRIPDDLYGRIEWHPDLSFSGDSLWCGFASPVN